MRLSSEYAVLMHPVVTEKTAKMAQMNQYVFSVHPAANKVQVREAVQKAFKVKVVDVRTWRLKGKLKRRGIRWVRRSDQKRAIVTLAKGTKLDLTAIS